MAHPVTTIQIFRDISMEQKALDQIKLELSQGIRKVGYVFTASSMSIVPLSGIDINIGYYEGYKYKGDYQLNSRITPQNLTLKTTFSVDFSTTPPELSINRTGCKCALL